MISSKWSVVFEATTTTKGYNYESDINRNGNYD